MLVSDFLRNSSVLSFILALSNILLSECTTIYLSISSTEGILAASKFLAITNYATVNIHVRVFVWT